MASSPIASSECDEGDLWGSDDEAGLDGETNATYHQTLNEDETMHDELEDPTSSILNLPPDSPSAISCSLPPTANPPSAISNSLPPTVIRRHPPVFQGAFSQARVQQPMMRSFTDAFNQRLPSLFHSSSALPTRATGSETGSISPLVDELDFGNLNPSALSGVREQYPEMFEEAAARFLEDFVTGPSISPPALISPVEDQGNRGSVDSSFGLINPNPQDEENDDETVAELSGSLTDSTVERNRPFVWPRTTTSGAQPSSSALRLSISSASGSNLPETDLSSTSSLANRNSALSLPSSSSVPKNANQPKAKPPGLFLPPRAPRLANDDRYTQTPFNSPCASGPSTPIPSHQPLTRTSRASRNSTSQGKTDRTGMLSSKKRKTTVALPPPPPPATDVAERRLSTVHDNLLKASASDGKTGNGTERRTTSGLPRRADIDQVRLLRQIRELRRGDGSSATIEKLEQEWEALLRRSDGLEAALELKRKATEHCVHLRRMKDALGSELVRVQIEESVLRHVRGIIADRRMRNETT